MNNENQKIILYIRFKVKNNKMNEFKESLTNLIETMKQEPSFISGILSDDVDKTNEITFFEVWKGTKESWLRDELPKPYREAYESELVALIDERIISYLTPTQEWITNILNLKPKISS